MGGWELSGLFVEEEQEEEQKKKKKGGGEESGMETCITPSLTHTSWNHITSPFGVILHALWVPCIIVVFFICFYLLLFIS